MTTPRVALPSNLGDGVEDVYLLLADSPQAHFDIPIRGCYGNKGYALAQGCLKQIESDPMNVPRRCGLLEGLPSDHAAVSTSSISISIPFRTP